jgi:hypothetical protein
MPYHCFLPETVLGQRPLAFNDDEAISAREDPFVALFEADIAITFGD